MEKIMCRVAMDKERKERIDVAKIALREVLGG
jgi:hypothetical protein|nr:MAG TPA: hypothetical protein [Caudoviricetes sp.]